MKICDVIKDLKGKWRGKSGNYRVDIKGDERDLTGRIDKEELIMQNKTEEEIYGKFHVLKYTIL